MPRFFLHTVPDDEAVLTGEDARHIAKSLRMQPGDAITLCDCLGYDYHGVIAEIGDAAVRVRILEIAHSFAEPSVRLTLCQGLPKGDKMDSIVQKAVELGISRVVPTLTARCVSRPDAKAAAKKQARWQKIALEASKQSGRGAIPQVEPLTPLAQAVAAAKGKRLLFYEGGGQRLTQLVAAADTDITLYIGPEGGFAPEEVRAVQAAGGFTATLGPRILRTETAPIAALSAILLLTGNL